MKICCISDTHGQHFQLDLRPYPADVLVYAGDWTRGQDTNSIETLAFLEWLEEQPYKHKVLVAGNHELKIEADLQAFIIALNEVAPSVTYLQDSAITLDGINFYGSPYSNEFYDWAFMEDDHTLSKVWDKIPENTNVLITHGPAYGCLDKVKYVIGRDNHVGSKSLTERKLSLQGSLKAHICGHIHEASGRSTTNNCININAAILNEQYNLVNKPAILEI